MKKKPTFGDKAVSKKADENMDKIIKCAELIHSARPIVTPVANIVFCCFVFIDMKRFLRTYGRTTWAKTMIPTGRDCGLAEWINIKCAELIIRKKKEKSISVVIGVTALARLFCLYAHNKNLFCDISRLTCRWFILEGWISR